MENLREKAEQAWRELEARRRQEKTFQDDQDRRWQISVLKMGLGYSLGIDANPTGNVIVIDGLEFRAHSVKTVMLVVTCEQCHRTETLGPVSTLTDLGWLLTRDRKPHTCATLPKPAAVNQAGELTGTGG